MNMKLLWGGRRRFLRISFTAIMAVATRSLFAAGNAAVARDPPRPALRLVDSLEHAERAAVVGRAYLATAPREADVTVLMQKIMREGDTRLFEMLRKDDDDGLRGFLTQRVRRDFRDGDVVLVRGWVLSRTESRVYALAALLHS